MKRILWATALTAAIVGGCTAGGRDRSWNIRMPDFGKVLSDWICDEESEADRDYDRYRRFWDQTPEGQRR